MSKLRMLLPRVGSASGLIIPGGQNGQVQILSINRPISSKEYLTRKCAKEKTFLLLTLKTEKYWAN